MDADFSHDPNDIPRLLHALQTVDLAIGSRYSHGISVINWPISRLLISVIGNIYVNTVTGMPFKDATGGFKAWRAETLRDIDMEHVHADGYGFQYRDEPPSMEKKERYCRSAYYIHRTSRRKIKDEQSNYTIEALLLVWKLRLFG